MFKSRFVRAICIMTLFLLLTGSWCERVFCEIAEPFIKSPADGSVYRIGDSIEFKVLVPDMDEWPEFYVDGVEQLLFPETDFWGWIFDASEFGDGEHIFEVVYPGFDTVTSRFMTVTNPQVKKAAFENGEILLTFTNELESSSLKGRIGLLAGGKEMDFTYSYEGLFLKIVPDVVIDDCIYTVTFSDGIESVLGDKVVQKQQSTRSPGAAVQMPVFEKKNARVSVTPIFNNSCRVYLAVYENGVLKGVSSTEESEMLQLKEYDSAAVFVTDENLIPLGDAWLDGAGRIGAEANLEAVSYDDKTVVTYDKDSGVIIVSGKREAHERVLVSITSEEGEYAALTVTHTDKEGKYAVAFTLDDKHLSGYYKVKSNSQSGQDEKELLYSNKLEAETLIPDFNKADDADKMKAIFKNKYLCSAIDYESFKSCDETIYELIANESTKAYTDISDIKKLVKKAICVNRVSAKDNSMKYITECADEFGFDLKMLNDIKHKDIFISIMEASAGESFEEFVKSYENGMLFARISDSDNAQTLLYLVTEEYADIFKIEETQAFGDYERIKEKVLVFEELLGEYRSLDAFLNAFEIVVPEVFDEQTKNNKKPSGGSSGGGGGGGVKVTNDYIKTPEVENKKIFNDMTGYEWANEAVFELSQKNIVSGYEDGTFRPSKSLTREEFIKLLVDAFSIKAENPTAHFVDVPDTRWSYSYVATAYSAGITAGIGDNMFGAENTVSREDMLTLLFRMVKAEKDITKEYPAPGYGDYFEISEYATEAVSFMAGEKLSKLVNNNKLMPKEGVQRAEAAYVIYNTLKYLEGDK